MDYERLQVPVDEIDTQDHTYRITTAVVGGDFKRSLAAVGLINPPLVIPKKNNFRIISGFRRVKAAKALGWTHLAAHIIFPQTSPAICARLAVADNAAIRQLNLIETSRALRLLRENLEKDAQLPAVVSELGLPANPDYIDKVMPLSRSSASLQSAILDGRIELAMATQLISMSTDQREVLVKLFETLQLNLNQQRQVLTLSHEISQREDLNLSDVFGKGDIADILADNTLDGPQKRHKVIFALKMRRFPSLTQAETNFNHHLKCLKLGQELTLLSPRDFEGTVYTLKIMFQDIAELKKRQKTLARVAEDPNLAAILARTIP